MYVYIHKYILPHRHTHTHTYAHRKRSSIATISRIDKIIRLFCKRALQKRQYSAKETSKIVDPTDRSHPIAAHWVFFCDIYHTYIYISYIYICYIYLCMVYIIIFVIALWEYMYVWERGGEAERESLCLCVCIFITTQADARTCIHTENARVSPSTARWVLVRNSAMGIWNMCICMCERERKKTRARAT